MDLQPPNLRGLDARAADWFARATTRWEDYPVEWLLARKRAQRVSVSVVIPARDEQDTVASVVGALRQALMVQAPLVDELVVIDSDSADGTAAAAARAGAVVYRASEVAPEAGRFTGKGEAVWKSLLVTTGDLLVFVDADLTEWGPHFVTGLLGPLLAGNQQVQLVKGCYQRRFTGTDGTTAGAGGGRVTELVARPLLSLWWPQLAGVVQPLAGEWAARRDLMESLAIPVGYGVELAVLLDVAERHGHRHQATEDLALMAAELMLVAERRCGGVPGDRSAGQARLQQFLAADGELRHCSRPVPVYERPPVRAWRAGALAGIPR